MVKYHDGQRGTPWEHVSRGICHDTSPMARSMVYPIPVGNTMGGTSRYTMVRAVVYPMHGSNAPWDTPSDTPCNHVKRYGILVYAMGYSTVRTMGHII